MSAPIFKKYSIIFVFLFWAAIWRGDKLRSGEFIFAPALRANSALAIFSVTPDSNKMSWGFLIWSFGPSKALSNASRSDGWDEEEKRRIKIIELEFHTLERKGNENGRIKDLFKKLGEYRIK